MNTLLIIGIIIGIFLVLGIIYLLISIRNKKVSNSIPESVVTDFEEAERRYKEANGRKTHQDILWDLAREHFTGTVAGDNKGERSDEIQRSSEQHKDIPSGSSENVTNDSERPSEDSGRDKPTIRKFRRI